VVIVGIHLRADPILGKDRELSDVAARRHPPLAAQAVARTAASGTRSTVDGFGRTLAS
jgi:hypothetical protein